MAPRRAPPPPAAGTPPREARGNEGEGASRRGLVFGVAGAAVVALGVGGYLITRPKTDVSVSSAPAPAPAPTAAPAPAAGPAAPPAPPPALPPAPSPPAAVAFSPVREFEKVVQAQAPGFGVRASAPKTNLRIGVDRFRFNVQADRPGHLYVLAVGPDGALAQIVPNRLSGPVKVRAGQNWQFPIKGGLELDAVEPAGPNHFLVIVSAEARNFDALKSQAEGDLRVFAGGEGAAAAVASHAGPGSVVAGRASCAPGATSCDESYGAAILKLDASR